MLQRRVTSGAIDDAVFFSMTAEMPSGPVALVVSRLDSRVVMVSSVHNRSLGHSSGETFIISLVVKGEADKLKFLLKVSLRRLAFSWEVDAVTLSVCNVGIPWFF